MRTLAVLLLVATACAPSGLFERAQTRLGASAKHVDLEEADRIAGDDVYVFCRRESRHGWGVTRRYNGACVVYVCSGGGDQCREE